MNDLTMAIYLTARAQLHGVLTAKDAERTIVTMRHLGVIPFPSRDLYREPEKRSRICHEAWLWP